VIAMMKKILIGACAMFAMASAAFADTGSVRIVVPAHDIARGETIADSDLSYQTIPATQAFNGIVTSMNELDGMQARRVLRAGETVRNDDVRHPILVTKGSTVTMTFVAPGVVLNATGKAVTEGGMGETVVVLNPVSYRQVSAVVTGAGQVRAGDLTRGAQLLAVAQQ
jgi:flagella basal body P-ring formation protein FlgA